MASVSASTAAALLMEHVNDQSIAEYLLSRSVSHREDAKLKPGISEQVAISYAKKDVVKANIAASNTTSAVALAKHAKDPRVSVRRRVAQNEHTDENTRLYLHGWGLGKCDDIVLNVNAFLPSKLSLDSIEAVQHPETKHWDARGTYPFQGLIRRVQAEGTKEAYFYAFSKNHLPLTNALLASVYKGDVPGLTLTEALTTAPTLSTNQAAITAGVAHVVDTTSKVTLELAKLLVAVASDISRVSYASRIAYARSRITVDTDAAILLAESKKTNVIEFISRQRLSNKALYAVLATKQVDALMNIIAYSLQDLTPAQTQKLAEAVADSFSADDSGHKRSIAAFLEETRHPVSTPVILTLLRKTNVEAVRRWLHGGFVNTPRPGEIKSILATPDVFIEYRHAGMEFTFANAAQVIFGYSAHNSQSLFSSAWADELVLALGEAFMPFALNYASAPYIAKRFEKAFGTDLELWEGAFTLMSDWSAGFDELLEVAFALAGKVPTETPEEVVVKPLVSRGVRKSRNASPQLQLKF